MPFKGQDTGTTMHDPKHIHTCNKMIFEIRVHPSIKNILYYLLPLKWGNPFNNILSFPKSIHNALIILFVCCMAMTSSYITMIKLILNIDRDLSYFLRHNHE